MESKQRKLNIYLLLFALFTCVCTALRTVASFTALNEYGYYDGALATVSGYLAAIGVLLLLSYAALYRADKRKQASFGGPLTYVPSIPLAICLVFLGIALLQKKAAAPIGRLLFPILALLAIASAFYFLLAVLHEHKLCELRAIFCMICTAFLILYAGYLYFDTALPLNAHTKICDQTAFVAAAIFFLFETRISLGREKWPLYTACGFAAASLCAYSSIPSLLVYLFKGSVISNSIEETLVTFFLFAYVFSRTVLSLLLKGESATPLMIALNADASARKEEVASHGPLPFEPQTAPIAQDGPEKAEAQKAETAPNEEIEAAEPDLACAQEDNNEENTGN
jgi:hypothetical protein